MPYVYHLRTVLQTPPFGTGLQNGHALKGKIAVSLEGGISYCEKAALAAENGAVALLVISATAEFPRDDEEFRWPRAMKQDGDDPPIPCVLLSNDASAVLWDLQRLHLGAVLSLASDQPQVLSIALQATIPRTTELDVGDVDSLQRSVWCAQLASDLRVHVLQACSQSTSISTPSVTAVDVMVTAVALSDDTITAQYRLLGAIDAEDGTVLPLAAVVNSLRAAYKHRTLSGVLLAHADCSIMPLGILGMRFNDEHIDTWLASTGERDLRSRAKASQPAEPPVAATVQFKITRSPLAESLVPVVNRILNAVAAGLWCEDACLTITPTAETVEIRPELTTTQVLKPIQIILQDRTCQQIQVLHCW